MQTKDATSVIDYVQSSSQALAVADRLLEKQSEEKKAAAEASAKVVPLLKELGLIAPEEVKQAEETLANHGQAVNVLHNVLTEFKRAVKEAKAKQSSLDLGDGVANPEAKQTKKTANWAGRRTGYDDPPRESDKKLLALIGK